MCPCMQRPHRVTAMSVVHYGFVSLPFCTQCCCSFPSYPRSRHVAGKCNSPAAGCSKYACLAMVSATQVPTSLGTQRGHQCFASPLQAKRLGNEIAAKQRDAEVTEQQIDAARVAYQPCGDYTSLLFFCISGKHPPESSLSMADLLRHSDCIRGP